MRQPRRTAGSRVLGLLPAVLAVAVWLLFLGNRAPGTAAALLGLPLDDAWIHMVYARSLATEGGFHYNVGVPEAGMTSPLWVVVLAGTRLLAGGSELGVVLGAKLAGLGLGLLSLSAAARLLRCLGEPRWVGLVAATLLAADPALAFARASGMEVSLLVLLALVSLLEATRGNALRAGAGVGLAVVARPEAVLLVPLVFAVLLRPYRPRAPAARLALALALAVLPAGLWSAFCLAATGLPLPNTFYAKFVAAGSYGPSRLAFGWRHYVRGGLPYFSLEAGTVLALLGAVRLARRGIPGLACLAAFALLFGAPLFTRGFSPGHFFYWERWLIPSFPFFLMAMAAGARETAGALGSFRRRGRKGEEAEPSASRVWRLGAAAILTLALAPLPAALIERARTYAWNCQNIEEVQVASGRWLSATAPPGATVGAFDAGAIRYFGQRRTIDLAGLNDHRVLEARRAGRAPRPEALGLDYLLVFPYHYADLERRGFLPARAFRSPRYTIAAAPQDLMLAWRRAAP